MARKIENPDVTFEQARQIVDDQMRAGWGKGSFWVAPYGYEHDRYIYVVYGSREWMLDHDRSFARPNDTHVFVRKSDGTLRFDCPLPTWEFFEESNPVGEIKQAS